MKKYLLLTIIFPLIVSSQSFVPNAPELNLKSYMLIEPNTNTIIAESNSDGLVEPASMTKVMTAYVVADQIKNDLISLDENIYFMSFVPVKIELMSLFLINVGTIIICYLILVIPSVVISKISPAKSIKFE